MFFIDDNNDPEFWTRDHYADDAPIASEAPQPRVPIYQTTDNFVHAKSPRLSYYTRSNGHQKLFVPHSLVLLAGPPKIGKTTIAIALAKAIAQGKSFGGFKQEQATVGYISFDDSPGEILATIDRHPDINENTNFFLNINAEPIDSRNGLEEIEDFLNKHRDTVVVIDSLHAAIKKSQTRDARAMRKLIDPLKRIAERAGTIILLHHTDARGNQIADHTQLQAAVSQTIQMKVEQRENSRIIHWKSQGRGRGVCRNAFFRSENETHYAPYNPNPLANLDPRDRSTKPILEALQQKPMKVRDLIAATGLSERRIYKRVHQLLTSSIIDRTPTGLLRFTA